MSQLNWSLQCFVQRPKRRSFAWARGLSDSLSTIFRPDFHVSLFLFISPHFPIQRCPQSLPKLRIDWRILNLRISLRDIQKDGHSTEQVMSKRSVVSKARDLCHRMEFLTCSQCLFGSWVLRCVHDCVKSSHRNRSLWLWFGRWCTGGSY